jgi:hypothetical protein
MFDNQPRISERVTDAVDLLIDFATLGEYGLQPVGRAVPACEARRRPASPRSSGSWNAAVSRFAAHS